MNAIFQNIAPPAQARAQRYGSGAVILRSRNPEGLTDDEIRGAAPSVFAEVAHESRSERYTYIPTLEMLAGLRRGGLVPVEVRQGGSRVPGKAEFTKHQIRLRPAGAQEQAKVLGGLYPEVGLLNSHDGTSAYQMDGALLRLICLNGLMVAESVISPVRVPHRGDVIADVIEGAYRILGEMPGVIDAAGEMDAVRLSRDEQLAFADAARALRWEAVDPQPEPAHLLHTRRVQDNTATLWGTFNAVQENLIRGGVGYQRTDERGRVQMRASRPVRNIDGDRGINRALWTLAENMRQLKQAA